MYLRFYMRRELSDSTGDPGRNFALAGFFPSVLARVVTPLAACSYRLARAVGIVPDLSSIRTGTMLDKTSSYEKKK